MIRLWLFALLATIAAAQVDAPKPSTGCVDHGKPCSKFVEKMVGQYPVAPIEVTHETWKEYAGKEAGFWTFRSNWRSPALRSNRKVFDKKFVAMHAGLWLTAVLACRNYKRTGEEWQSEMPGMAAETGMDFIWSKWFIEAGGVLPADIYGMVHYSRALAYGHQ